VLGFAAALLLVLPILHLLLQLLQRNGTRACFEIGALLASGAALFGSQFHALRSGLHRSGAWLLTAGALGILGSVFVARVLGWRSGALWP
jgi:hypothetical protein